MNQKVILRSVIATLENNIIALAANSRDMREALDAMAVQISALRTVVTEMHLIPEPDAEGWIPRPTLR